MQHQQSDNSCVECGKAWPCEVAKLEAKVQQLRDTVAVALEERDYYRNQVDGLTV